MMKTVKVKKKLRLDELIKYIFDNKIADKKFSSDIKLEPYYDNKNSVYVQSNGTISLGLGQINVITPEDTFTVEVEEEITRSTIFDCLVRVGKDGVVERTHCSISGIKNENTIRIYALLDGKLELIYERNDGSSQCTVKCGCGRSENV